MLDSIASFGEDALGELYVVDFDGDVFKIGSRIFGDATNDGKVNGADYTVWADHYFDTGVGFDLGDFNRDGIVDGATTRCGPTASNRPPRQRPQSPNPAVWP